MLPRHLLGSRNIEADQHRLAATMPHSTIDGSRRADGTNSDSYDYMFVDAGIAGSTLASRASQNAFVSTLYRF